MTKSKSLVLDVGTTGVKAFIFNRDQELLFKAYKRLGKKYPKQGWVEQDPQELVDSSIEVIRSVVKQSGINPKELKSFGITNQRETIIAWDKKTGKVLYPAIVWQDTRAKALCAKLTRKFNNTVQSKTGLVISPYFSASKIEWLLSKINNEHLSVGTVDSWLMFNLLKGYPHLTDQTNASRTLLFNIHKLTWDRELLSIFCVPASVLPEVKNSSSNFGVLNKSVIGIELPLLAVVGDQEASLYAVGSKRGVTKITFGTGTFVMQNLGNKFSVVEGFYTTLAASKGYAVEAKIDFGSSQVDPLLSNPKKLKRVLIKAAKSVAKIVTKLPIKPKKLIIDGGISMNKDLQDALSEATGVRIEMQTTYDGTALGVAKILSLKDL